MGIFAKIKEKLRSYWTPYEVTYIGGYDAKELRESDNPARKLASWQAENKAALAEHLPRAARNEKRLQLAERFARFPERRRNVLIQMAKQYSALRGQKQEAKDHHEEMREYLNQVNDLTFGEDLPRVLKIIEENELEFQKAQKDLSYLEGERSGLEYEFKRSQIGLFITGVVLYVAVAAAILGTIFLFLLSKRQNIFVPAVVLILSIGFFGIWAAVFRRYFRSALEKNGRMQQRAVKLMNKVKLKYVRYRQLLDYEYEKFEVNSSEGLRLRYEIFTKEKHQRQRYEDLEKQQRLAALDIARELASTLPEKEEELMDLFLQDSDYYATSGGRDRLKERLLEEKEELSRRGRELENEQKVLRQMEEMLPVRG